MGDNYIRLIPTKLTWQPDETAAAAVAYVTALFSGPGDSVDEVASCPTKVEGHLLDSCVNTDMAACPACGAQVDLEWVFDVVSERMDDLSNLDVVVPGCGAVVSLNELDYVWPVGFARFEVAALNGSRAEYALNADELMHVGTLLGHPVRHILAHYQERSRVTPPPVDHPDGA